MSVDEVAECPVSADRDRRLSIYYNCGSCLLENDSDLGPKIVLAVPNTFFGYGGPEPSSGLAAQQGGKTCS